MAVLSKGTTFATNEQVTEERLNNLVDNAAFAAGAVDGVTTTLVNGAIVLGSGGVGTQQLKDATSTTTGVTFPKMRQIADYKVIGNVSGGTAAPAEIDILDEDDMASDSATALATQQSIKAKIDNAAEITPPSSSNYSMADSGTATIGGLVFKFGRITSTLDTSETFTFPVAFPNACLTVLLHLGAGGLHQDYEFAVTSFNASGFTVNRYDQVDGSGFLHFFCNRILMFPEIRPITTQEELANLKDLAAQDSHFLLYPTHSISKSNEVIGYLSINATPIVNVWTHTQKAKASDSIVIMSTAEAIMADRKINQYIIPCEQNSPYFNKMEKLGYTRLGFTSFNIKNIG